MKVNAFEVNNYKSIENSGKIRIDDLSILIGENNSGKSSLIQTLFLMKQSLLSMDTRLPLVLNGYYVNVGTYYDIIFKHELDRRLKITFYLSEPFLVCGICSENILNLDWQIEWHFSHRHNIKSNLAELRKQINDVTPKEVKLAFTYSYDSRYNIIYLEEFEINQDDNFFFTHLLLKRTLRKMEINSSLGTYYIPLKESFELNYQNLRDLTMFFDLPKDDYNHLNFSISGILTILEDFLRNLYIITPYRSPPNRIYSIDESRSSVGIMGEYTFSLLYSNIIQGKDLETDLNDLLKQLEFPFKVKIIEVKKRDFFQVFILEDDIEVNVTNVGLGISYILPFLVEGLLLSRKQDNRGESIHSYANTLISSITPINHACLVIEHPELHLNPKLQSKIGDYLSSLRGKTSSILIETHSEHLLSRIQRRVAEGKLDPQEISIYFLKKEKGCTKVCFLKISGEGDIKDFPKDFFDEHFKEGLALLKTFKKNVKDNEHNE